MFSYCFNCRRDTEYSFNTQCDCYICSTCGNTKDYIGAKGGKLAERKILVTKVRLKERWVMKVGDVVYRFGLIQVPGEVIEVFDPPIQKPGSWKSTRLEPLVDTKVRWLDGTETYEMWYGLCNLFNVIEFHRAQAEKYKKIYNLIESWEECKETTIVIEVLGGVVVNVMELPDGWDYEVVDYDD